MHVNVQNIMILMHVYVQVNVVNRGKAHEPNELWQSSVNYFFHELKGKPLPV